MCLFRKLIQQISVHVRPTWRDIHKQTWENNINATSATAYINTLSSKVSHIRSIYIILHPAMEGIAILVHGL